MTSFWAMWRARPHTHTHTHTHTQVISGQCELCFTLIFHGLNHKHPILKTSWPPAQMNRLVRVHAEFSDAVADFRDSAGGSDDDDDDGDGGDDDGDGDDDTVEAESLGWKEAAPSSCHTNPCLNSWCVCPTGPKLSHAFWSSVPPSSRPLQPSSRPTTMFAFCKMDAVVPFHFIPPPSPFSPHCFSVYLGARSWNWRNEKGGLPQIFRSQIIF